MTVLVLIASIEAILIAALGTSIIAAVGQSTGSFTGVTQWAVYSYGGILVATTLAQCVIISISSGKLYNTREVHLAAVADAQCAATFQIFVYYSVFILKAVSFSSATPAVDRFIVSGINNTTRYSVNNRLNWFLAAVGDSGWEQSDDGIFTSNLSRVGLSGTTGSIVGQIFVGFTVAYLLVMLMGSVYISYSSAKDGVSPRLFTNPASIIVANGLVVVGMGETVEIGFMGCKYAGLTANSVGLMILGALLIFDRALVEMCVYLAWLVPKKGQEWINYASINAGDSVKNGKGTPHEAAKLLYQHGVARPLFHTAMGIIPTLVCLTRNPWENGHVVTMVASITLASLSIWSTWMNMWVSQEIIKSAQQPESAKITIQKAEITNAVQEMAWRAPSPPPLGGATRKSVAGGVAQGITSVFSLYSPSTHVAAAKTGRYSA